MNVSPKGQSPPDTVRDGGSPTGVPGQLPIDELKFPGKLSEEEKENIRLGGTTEFGEEPAGPINSIAGVTATEAWAAGDGGVLLRYSEGSWSRVDIGRTQSLHSLAVVSPDNVWMLADPGRSGSLVVHFDGASWRNIEGPPLDRPDYPLVALAADPNGEIWVVTDLPYGEQPTSMAPVEFNPIWHQLWHWDGQAWTKDSLVSVRNVRAIPDLVASAEGGTVRYDRGFWKELTGDVNCETPWPLMLDGDQVVGLGGTWICRGQLDVGFEQSGQLPKDGDPYDHLWRSPGGTLWIGGSAATLGWSAGEEWTFIQPTVPEGSPLDWRHAINGLWGTADDDVWAVSEMGLIHYDGATADVLTLPE